MTKPVSGGKIFCIGFEKTGTTSLEVALTQLGYSVCGIRYDLIDQVRENDTKAICDVVDAYDAFEDNPWPLLYTFLDITYPGSKFILSLRDEAIWIKSVVNHFGSKPHPMKELVYGYPYPKGFEDQFLDVYRKHNAAAQKYFTNRKEDFLVMDFSARPDWYQICSFLEKPIPSIPFPHANRGKYTKVGKMIKFSKRKFRLLKKKLKRIFKL